MVNGDETGVTRAKIEATLTSEQALDLTEVLMKFDVRPRLEILENGLVFFTVDYDAEIGE